MRQGEEEAEQVEQEYRQAKTRSEQEDEETAQTLAARRELTADEQGELRKLWKKLVSLYHPDRFAREPDKLATCEKLTAAINHAKVRGDLEALRQIAGDPHGFILDVILSEAEALRSAVEGPLTIFPEMIRDPSTPQTPLRMTERAGGHQPAPRES